MKIYRVYGIQEESHYGEGIDWTVACFKTEEAARGRIELINTFEQNIKRCSSEINPYDLFVQYYRKWQFISYHIEEMELVEC